MKKLFLFLAVASTTIFTSCSTDDANNGPTATSIVLTADVTEVIIGETVTFTVTNNLNAVVTSTTNFTANDAAISGAVWTPTTPGTFQVKAMNGQLVSNVITVIVSDLAVANNSFVIDNVNYETPNALFQYLGIAQLPDNSYVIGWAYNPYLEVDTAGTFTYPTDLYIYTIYAITPTGTDPATGDPTFTITSPTAGTFNYDAAFTTPSTIFDVQFDINSTSYLPTVAAERALLIEGVTLNITQLDLDSAVTNLASNYTITLTDGTVVNGEYSGETGVYGLPAARTAKAKKISSFDAKTQQAFNTFKKSNLKK